MDTRLEYLIAQENYNLSEETIVVLEEFLAQNPNITSEQLLEKMEWIAALK